MLRGVASLLVLFFHYFFIFWMKNKTLILAFPYIINKNYQFNNNFVNKLESYGMDLGALGVAIFFLISGFVIALTLEKFNNVNFIITRFFRIFPTYIIGFSFTFISIFVYCKFFHQTFPYTINNYFIQISLLRDWFWVPSIDGVSWTLETELKFYIIILLISCLGKLNKPKCILSVSFTLCLINILANNWYGFFLLNNTRIYQFLYIITFSSPLLIFMFIGVIFYNYMKKYLSFRDFCFSMLCSFSFFFVSVYFGPDKNQQIKFFFNYTIALIVFTVVFYLKEKIKFNKLLNFFGNISYPLYVIHGLNGYLIMSFLYHFGVNQIFCTFIAMCLSVLFAYLLHILIEIPTNIFGKEIVKRIKKLRPV